jgi:hypothetical protein
VRNGVANKNGKCKYLWIVEFLLSLKEFCFQFHIEHEYCQSGLIYDCKVVSNGSVSLIFVVVNDDVRKIFVTHVVLCFLYVSQVNSSQASLLNIVNVYV